MQSHSGPACSHVQAPSGPPCRVHCLIPHAPFDTGFVYTAPGLSYSPNDLMLASSSLDGCVYLYELDTFQVTASIHSGGRRSIGGRGPAAQWAPDELEADGGGVPRGKGGG